MSKFARNVRGVLLLAAAAGMGVTAACGTGKNDGGGGSGDFAKATKWNPKLLVTDDAGNPIAGAKVTYGAKTATTGADGTATLGEQPRGTGAVATVTADGYAPNTTTLTIDNSFGALELSLTKTRIFSVNSAIGGRVSAGYASVTLPGNGFTTAAGAPYTGEVKVEVAPVADDELQGRTSSHDYQTAGASGNEPVILLGGVHVNVKAADGSKLGFARSERPQVSVLLPDSADAKEGDTLPLYELDEPANLWTETSSCAVGAAATPLGARKLACVGSVEHFSAVAVGTATTKRYCLNFASDTDIGLQWAFNLEGCTATGGTAVSVASTFTSSISSSKNKAYIFSASGAIATCTGLVTTTSSSARVTDRRSVSLSGDGNAPAVPRVADCQLVGVQFVRNGTVNGQPFFYATLDPNTTGTNADNDESMAIFKMGTQVGGDCNDNDASIYPGARRIYCSDKDHDCNGKKDSEDFTTLYPTTAEQDLQWNSSCVSLKAACADVATRAEVPGNGRDENCDGVISDADNDMHFVKGDKAAPAGKDDDCDDNDKTAFPGATEIPGMPGKPNYVDENCDGVAADQDGDTFPSIGQTLLENKTLTTTDVDCNDLDPLAHPGATVKDLSVLADYYVGANKQRKADFCSLFDAKGKGKGRLRYLFFKSDRNCNGILEDLDGDGVKVASGGPYTNAAPYDANDLDPRVKTKTDTVASALNDKECTPAAPDLANFGAGTREVCPRLFGDEQFCRQTQVNGKLTDVWVCASDDYKLYSVPPNPYNFGAQYSPCTAANAPNTPANILVCPEPAGRLWCAGPVPFDTKYKEKLRAAPYSKSVPDGGFQGFCMPECSLVK